MQVTASITGAAAQRAAVPRRCARVAVVCSAEQAPVTRRSALSGLLALPALLAAEPALAFGKDPRQAQRDKDARREKLKASAAKMKSSQKSEQTFADSNYSLPEEATTPNMRGGATKPPQRADFD